MPCQADVLTARANIARYTRDYCAIRAACAPKEIGLPAWIAPPKNSTRRTPDGALLIPNPPAGADQLVFAYTMPLGYDGILTQITNIWNGAGFVEASGDITWRVKRDRVFLPDFEAITTTRGNLAAPFPVTGAPIFVYSGQTLYYFANFAVGSGDRLGLTGKTYCALTLDIWPRERKTILSA